MQKNNIKTFTNKEIKNIPYKDLVATISTLNSEEIIELSNKVGYPVFTRLCMGLLKHKFILLQDGAAAIILNDKNQILMQRRSDDDKWGLPGGCQELGEKFEDTIIREVKEETNLDINENDLQLIRVVSGPSRKRQYPNGDIVYNNTILYLIKTYSGQLKWNEESKVMQFFDVNSIPENQHDKDLITIYQNFLIQNPNI